MLLHALFQFIAISLGLIIGTFFYAYNAPNLFIIGFILDREYFYFLHFALNYNIKKIKK